jgi:hypothetical protein
MAAAKVLVLCNHDHFRGFLSSSLQTRCGKSATSNVRERLWRRLIAENQKLDYTCPMNNSALPHAKVVRSRLHAANAGDKLRGKIF